MSNKVFSLSVNGKDVALTSPATRDLLEVILLIDNPLADSIQSALDKKAIPAGATEGVEPQSLREFFHAQFTEGKNAEDLFKVTIDHDNGAHYEGSATRQVIANRLLVATNIADYRTTIVKNVPQTAEGKSPKAKAAIASDDV